MFVANQHLNRDSLPDEDPETQATLLRRMLEILANIETLTLTEKTSVQANLTTLSSHSTSSSSTLVSNQPRYTSHLKADL